jgi:phosphatidylserine/phosphatidylglycerophosphate/cardiolipin synthase-like enzyme
MKRTFLFILFLFPAFLIGPGRSSALTLRDTPAEVYFSPRGGATEALVHRLDQAQHSIFVLADNFTSSPIARVLAEAAFRGVHVSVILDSSQRVAKGGKAFLLEGSGAHLYATVRPSIEHNKMMVIDGHTVVTGSYSYTAGADEKNAGNLLILDSPELAKLYLSQWVSLKEQAEPW